MRHLTLMFAALALVACGGSKKLQQQDVDPIATNSTPSYSIEEIDAELATMLSEERGLEWYDYENDISNCELKDSLQRAFEKRMEYHLCNPLTFTESLPELEEMVSVITVPSGRCKFYNYSLDSGGPMSDDKNFIQYRDANGNVRCFPYMNDLTICNGPRGICDVWEFELENKFYYAIKTYRRQAWYAWTYYLDIITIEDDKIVTCSEFFSELHGWIYDTDEFFVYDENGKFLDEVWLPTYYIAVCGTQTGNNNVDFDFDPKTLTVKVRDDGDWTNSRTGAIIESEWRLSVPDNDIDISFDVKPTEGFDGYNDVTLTITKRDKDILKGFAGRVYGDFEYDKANFKPTTKNGAITAPNEVLFFADIDFDGTDEIITGVSPFGGSQRDLPAFTSVYKLIDGEYTDIYDELRSKSKAFEYIEPYMFIVDYRDKAIVVYNDGGINSGGWEVYKYDDGKYTYDRYISFNRDHDNGKVEVIVYYDDNRGTRTYTPMSYIFDEHLWRYE